MAKMPGPIEIQNITVDPVLEPTGELRASLRIMPSWQDTWSVRVRLWMGNDCEQGLEQTWISVPQKVVMPDAMPVSWEHIFSGAMAILEAANTWRMATVKLASFASLGIRPSYDIGKAAVFTLILKTSIRIYDAETSEELRNLHRWFRFEG